MPPSKKQSVRARLDAKGKPASSKPLAEESADLWKLIETWIHKRFGLRGLFLLACIFYALTYALNNWKDVKEWPVIKPLVAQFTEKALPKADPGKFNIAITHLEGGDKHEMERLIRESLAEFPGVATLSFDRLIASEQGDSEKDEREGHERARTLLKASGADVLIWGVVLKQGDKSVPKLYWTPSRDVAKAPSAGHYQATEDLRFQSIFWQDLTNVLGLLVATSEAEFGAQEGQYKADKPEPFILRVRGLLRSSKVEQWNAATRAEVLAILGNALTTYGEQSGRSLAIGDHRLLEPRRVRLSLPQDAEQPGQHAQGSGRAGVGPGTVGGGGACSRSLPSPSREGRLLRPSCRGEFVASSEGDR